MRFFFVIFERISQLFEYLNVLVILTEFFFCMVDGRHEFAICFGSEIMGRVVINELPELQRTQLSTNL